MVQSILERKNLAASPADFVYLPTFSGIRGNASNSTDLNFPTGLLPGSLFLYNNRSEVQTLLKQVMIKLMFSYTRKKLYFRVQCFQDSSEACPPWDTSSLSKSPSRPSLPSALNTDIKVDGCIRTRERSWEIHLQKCATKWKTQLQPVTNEAWPNREGSKLRVGTRPLQSELASHWSRLLFERDVPWERKFLSQGQGPWKTLVAAAGSVCIDLRTGSRWTSAHLQGLHNVTLLPASDLTPSRSTSILPSSWPQAPDSGPLFWGVLF